MGNKLDNLKSVLDTGVFINSVCFLNKVYMIM